MRDLTVVIPARNERWLARTIADVLMHATADTEVVAILDGAWADPGIPQHERVTVVRLPAPIGQRAATNLGVRLSDARYVMKLDGHCAVAPGFDAELIAAAETLGPDVTQVPAQYNLHVFDLVCDVGHRTYQGPTDAGCPHVVDPATQARCGRPVAREEVWKIRKSRRTEAWRFDSTLHFQYWGDYRTRPAAQGDVIETMSCLGACWFLARERYWALGGLDEGHGSWGNMGTEVACKAWLSGGRLVTNKRTWFGHMFRTQGGDFGFPYPIRGEDQEKARAYSRALWMGGAWHGAVRPLSWLVDRFWPVPGWREEDRDNLQPRDRRAGPGVALEPAALEGGVEAAAPLLLVDHGVGAPAGTASHGLDAPQPSGRDDESRAAALADRVRTKGVVYYTDNRGDAVILDAVRDRLATVAPGPIVAVSLAPVAFGQNVVVDAERGYLTMFRQILAGLEASTADVVFLCEHDVLYHPSHFAFTPPRADTFYYNQHVWKVDAATGRALHYRCSQTSGLCADRQLLIAHYRARVARVEREGFSRSMGFEPGTRQIRHGGIDDRPAATWMSAAPNVDIRHGANLTPSRWRRDQFRNQKFCQGWTEADAVPGWGVTAGRFRAFLAEAVDGVMVG